MDKGTAKYFDKLSKEAMAYASKGLLGPLSRVCEKASQLACTLEEREQVGIAKEIFIDIANSARVESHLKGALGEAKKGDVKGARDMVEYAKRTAYDAELPFDDERANGILYSAMAFSAENEFRKLRGMEGRPVEEIDKSMDAFREKVSGFSGAERRLVEKKISVFMEGVYLSGIEEELKKAYDSSEKDAHVARALEYAEKLGMPESDVSIIKFRAVKMGSYGK